MRFYLRNDISGGKRGERLAIEGVYKVAYVYMIIERGGRDSTNRRWRIRLILNFIQKMNKRKRSNNYRCIKIIIVAQLPSSSHFEEEKKKRKNIFLPQLVQTHEFCLKWDKIIPWLFHVFLYIMFARYDKLRATLYIRPPRWISIRITATVGRWDLGLFLQPSPSPAFPAWVNNSQRHEENVAPLW